MTGYSLTTCPDDVLELNTRQHASMLPSAPYHLPFRRVSRLIPEAAGTRAAPVADRQPGDECRPETIAGATAIGAIAEDIALPPSRNGCTVKRRFVKRFTANDAENPALHARVFDLFLEEVGSQELLQPVTLVHSLEQAATALAATDLRPDQLGKNRRVHRDEYRPEVSIDGRAERANSAIKAGRRAAISPPIPAHRTGKRIRR